MFMKINSRGEAEGFILVKLTKLSGLIVLHHETKIGRTFCIGFKVAIIAKESRICTHFRRFGLTKIYFCENFYEGATF